MCSEHHTVCVLSSVTEHEEDSYFSIPKDGMDGDQGVLVLLKAIKLTQISRNPRQASSLQNWSFSRVSHSKTEEVTREFREPPGKDS